MNHKVNQELKHLEILEQRFFNQSENLVKSTVTPIMDKIENKIPLKLKSALDLAFYKGFQLVFEKGSPYIEKTYPREKIEMDFDINNYAVNKAFIKRNVKRLDHQSKQSKMINSSFSALEGGVLGLLGIGIPDIPLFLSVMVKTIYEIALSYGFQYQSEGEKTYILLLICTALSKGERQREFASKLDLMGADIDRNVLSEVNLADQMKLSAEVLSEALLTAKFIQGIPLIGAVGGAVNYYLLNRVAKYTRIKYKKRYLEKILSEL
jgi:hypothetical protein